MAVEQVTIFELDINVEAATKDLARNQKAVQELKQEIKELKKAEGDNSVAIAQKTAELKAEQKQLSTNTNLTKQVIAAQKANAGSIDQLRAQLSIVSIEWAKLSEFERKNTERGKELTAQKKELTEALEKEEKATGDARRGVGKYSEGVKEALGGTAQFGEGLLKLAANPVVLTITAIVAALKFLFDSFTKTQSGADKLNKISDVLGATLQVLQGIAADLTNKIIEVFENPQQALKDFANLLKENITNRVTGLIELLPKLGKAITLLFKGEFKEAGKVATDAVGKVALGVENITDKAIELKNDAVEAFAEITTEINKAAQAAFVLRDAQIALEEANIKATTTLAKLNSEAELQQQIADDSTQSFRVQEEAAEKARVASEKASEESLKLARQELDIIKLRNAEAQSAGFLTRELRQEQADAAAKVIELGKQQTLTVQNNAKVREEIQRDLFEKNLDFLLDNFDNVKSINERLAADDKKSFGERSGIIEATRQLSNAAFDEQIAQLQTRTDETIKANDLIAESDSRRLIEKVRLLELDEIEETRLLEVLRDRRTALQDLAEAEVEIEQQKLDALQEAKVIDLENRLSIEQDNIFATLDLEREKLAAQEAQEIEFAQRIGVSTTNIEKKFSKARTALNKAEFNAKLSLASDFAGNIAQIAGEGTAIGKAAAVAQTTISTIQGAQGAFSALAPIPVVGPALGIAAAAAAIAAGVANVKKILAVKSGLPNEKSVSAPSISASSPSGVGSAVSQATRPQSIAPSVNEGIVSRDSGVDTGDNGIVLQPTLVTDDVTTAQTQEAANAQTSVA